MQTQERIVTCIGCKKQPEQIREFKIAAHMEKISATQWVIENEAIGVWGTNTENKFYCTSCYIKAGMPIINVFK